MKLSYGPKDNVAYIRLHDRTDEVETIRVSEEVNVDIAPDGTVYGIEPLSANHQLACDGGKMLTVVNEDTGESTKVSVPL